MAKAKKRKPVKAKRTSGGALALVSWEMVLPGVVLLIAVLVALSPYLFQFWMTPDTQKKLTRAMTESTYERAPASAQAD